MLQWKHAVDDETCMQHQTYKTRFSCNRDMIFLPKCNNNQRMLIDCNGFFYEQKQNDQQSIIKVLKVQRDAQTWRIGRPKVLNDTGAAPRLSFGWWYLHVDPYLHVPVLRKYCNAHLKQVNQIEKSTGIV